jgi:hypothetical protein
MKRLVLKQNTINIGYLSICMSWTLGEEMISEEKGAIFLTSSNSSIISYDRSKKGTIIVRVCGHIKVFGIALIF